MKKKKDLIDCTKVFEEIDSSPQTIITKGIRFLLAFYGAPKKIDCTDKYRYLTFVKNTRNKKQVQLSCLPLTSASAHQHLYRAFYQVQAWLGGSTKPRRLGLEINTQYFGTDSNYPPTEILLNTIFYEKGCSTKCGCRRVGLSCSPACTNCQSHALARMFNRIL